MSKKSRTEVLAAVLLAFSQNATDGAGLTAAEWEWAEHEIETRFGGDFDKLAAHLAKQERALSLACAVMES